MICAGVGRKWQSGMGRAVCPVCHRSARSLGATTVGAPQQWKQLRGKIVPEHNYQHRFAPVPKS